MVYSFKDQLETKFVTNNIRMYLVNISDIIYVEHDDRRSALIIIWIINKKKEVKPLLQSDGESNPGCKNENLVS